MSIIIRPFPACLDIHTLVHFNRQRYPAALVSTACQAVNQSADLNTANLKKTALKTPGLKKAGLKKASGRYDIVFACPQRSLQLSSAGELYYSVYDKNAQAKRLSEPPVHDSFFAELERFCEQQKTVIDAETKPELPFYGGWFVYLSYEMAAEVEPCLQLPPANSDLPLAIAIRIPAAVIRDRTTRQCYIVAEKTSAALLATIEHDCVQLSSQQASEPQSSATIQPSVIQPLIESPEAPYLAQLERIKQYIYDGDIFQANLSRLWRVQLAEPVDDLLLFNLLAENNPASFAALLCLEDAAIISSSPERLLSKRGHRLETRPIAGTRPRSERAQIDASMADALLAHPKEQAEHIMLIDLERNDMGRVCEPGSIRVDELMVLESWQHVHHIVSNISGRCRADKSSVEVLTALFPGGTITGCPKVRCMEILAEQEQQPRGAYTGSLGYINIDGDMDFNILIRTMVREHDWISFRAGGGIVADSDPQHELAETRAKARGLLKVFQADENPAKKTG